MSDEKMSDATDIDVASRRSFGMKWLMLVVVIAAGITWLVVYNRPMNKLTRALHSPNAERRTWAIGEFRTLGETGIPTLVQELRHGDQLGKEMAAWVLASLGPRAVTAVPDIQAALKDPIPTVRALAVDALVKTATDPKIVLPELTSALADASSKVKNYAVAALSRRFVGEAKPAIPALAEVIKSKANDDDWELDEARTAAARLLSRLSPDSIAPLIEILLGDDALARALAGDSLGRIGEAAVAPLLEATKGKLSGSVLLSVLQTFARIGPSAKPASEWLYECLKHSEPSVQTAAAWALWRVDQNRDAAVPVLIASLKSQTPDVVVAATAAIGNMGTSAKAAIPALAELLDADSPQTRQQAITALGRMGSEAAGVISKLVTLLDDKDPDVRRMAAATLGRMGSAAREAVPRLIVMSQDEVNLQARQTAGTALAAIDLTEAAKLGIQPR